MFIRTAYDRRKSLSDAELDRLLLALKDEVEQYRFASRNYPPDRMERHGKPFLFGLEERVNEVERLISERATLSNKGPLSTHSKPITRPAA